MMNNEKSIIQDSTRAVEHFSNELDFSINPDGLKDIIDSTQDMKIKIIDVRREELFDKSHIPGAINIPFDKYNSFDCNDTEFHQLSKHSYNYIYCYSLLCKLGKQACLKFASLGYPVKEIQGGFQYWLDYGYSTETKVVIFQ